MAMSNTYDDCLRRFILYRIRMNMSQEEMGRILGKTQSQLSKMELRKTIIPFGILDGLQHIGWDIDDIVIGKEKVNIESSLSEYLTANVGNEWKAMKEVLIWIIGIEFQKNGGFQDADSKFEYELLRALLYKSKLKTVMRAVRDVMGIRQDKMAEMLGVDVKKCRDMERGRIYPDAELLVLIYEISSCRPAVFFCRENVEGYLLDNLWNKLDIERRREAKVFLDEAVRIYKAQ